MKGRNMEAEVAKTISLTKQGEEHMPKGVRWLVCLFLALGFHSMVAAGRLYSQGVSFQPAVNYAAGTGPASVAVADFNNDGNLDLVVASFMSSDANVLLGNGDGTFQTYLNYQCGAGSFSVAVGDFNNDGNLDLAVANIYSNNVSVLLGNGDGNFQDAVNYPTDQFSRWVALGDFNNDGKLDLAVANSDSDNVSVLLGNGDGTFQQPPVNYPVGSSPHSGEPGLRQHLGTAGEWEWDVPGAVNYAVGDLPRSVAVGDFDGDEIADLAVSNFGSDNVSVLLGNGSGTFQTAVNYTVGLAPMSVAVGDFNSDGTLDLAVANVSVLLGNGMGRSRIRRTSMSISLLFLLPWGTSMAMESPISR